MPSYTHESMVRVRWIIDRILDNRHKLVDVVELEAIVTWLAARLEAYETERDPQ